MSKHIVVINGTGGSGKDTFVQYASKYAKVANFSSIDKVKEIASYAGWEGAKEEKDRKFLSDLKDLLTNYNDLPYQTITAAIKDFENSDNELMFIHIREPKEIQRVVDNFNAKSLLIKRLNYEIITSNSSDANVENYDYDYIIENDTLEKLEKDAKDFVNNIKDE